jgi:hypothetical protein
MFLEMVHALNQVGNRIGALKRGGIRGWRRGSPDAPGERQQQSRKQ